MGHDWHPACLRCEECGKVLNPGTHAEVRIIIIVRLKTLNLSFQHKEVPYCHVPCYAALFGPKLFGHGSTTESHR